MAFLNDLDNNNIDCGCDNNYYSSINNSPLLCGEQENAFNPDKSNLNKLNGSFIQLGAFSKYPSKAYLNNIQSKGYAVKIHKVEINGKFYHKLLIGPYKTQKESRSNLSKIRKDLKSPKAFIYQ